MKIVVCIKLTTGAAVDSRDAFLRVAQTLPSMLPPHDARAVEAAIRIRDQVGSAEIVALAIGRGENLGGVRDAIAMGVDRGVLLCDPALEGADLLATSRALAALMRREAADLYLYCSWSGDIDGSLLWTMTAERMGLPTLGQVHALSLDGNQVTGERQADRGDYIMKVRLPCLIEVTENINRPRYITIKGKQIAKSRLLQLLTLEDIGLDATAMGAATRLIATTPTPSTRKAMIIDGDANAPQKILDFLAERKVFA